MALAGLQNLSLLPSVANAMSLASTAPPGLAGLAGLASLNAAASLGSTGIPSASSFTALSHNLPQTQANTLLASAALSLLQSKGNPGAGIQPGLPSMVSLPQGSFLSSSSQLLSQFANKHESRKPAAPSASGPVHVPMQGSRPRTAASSLPAQDDKTASSTESKILNLLKSHELYQPPSEFARILCRLFDDPEAIELSRFAEIVIATLGDFGWDVNLSTMVPGCFEFDAPSPDDMVLGKRDQGSKDVERTRKVEVIKGVCPGRHRKNRGNFQHGRCHLLDFARLLPPELLLDASPYRFHIADR
jgi:hypothetical protein